MNFLEISMFYYPLGGGATKTTDSMVTALCKEGHKVHLVYPIFPISSSTLQDDNIKKNKIKNLELYPVYVKPKFSYQYLRIYDWFTRHNIYKNLYIKCKTILETENIDFIISHFHESTQIGLVGHVLSTQYNLPHITKVHDIYAFHSFYPEIFYSIKNYFYSKKVLKKSYISLFPNRSMRSKAIERYNLNPANSIILPNGLNFDDYDRYNNINKIKKYKINLVFVGGLYRNRKLYNLLDSLKKINMEFNGKINLFIIGDGPEKHKLLKMVQQNNSQDIKICGNLPHNEVLNIINKSHIGIGLIEKNKDSEYQMPIKIIEYMAMGVPWISVKHEGIIELNESDSGIILENSSVESIKSAILSLITEPIMYESMSRAGRKYAREHFDWDKNIQYLLEHLDNIGRRNIKFMTFKGSYLD